jgi:hypothetical protein
MTKLHTLMPTAEPPIGRLVDRHDQGRLQRRAGSGLGEKPGAGRPGDTQ